MITFLSVLFARGVRLRNDEGFSTAELLGNAALGIAALVAIWGLLQVLGLDVIEMIRGQIIGGTGG